MNKILWKTFEKTFYLDPDTGVLRGWNIRLEQTGWNNPAIPKIKNGTPFTFGHYELRSTEGETFPKNWQGAQYLNYADAGNTYFDLARFTASPVVAINREKSDLLLGWEVFKIGFKKIAIADYWLLVEDGPIEYIAERPVE